MAASLPHLGPPLPLLFLTCLCSEQFSVGQLPFGHYYS
uniref:Uncharacterized protein n=1 Tax=Anguilla anguilla TaxID=7936 RepID=A0A0E9R3U6_ANGAN